MMKIQINHNIYFFLTIFKDYYFLVHNKFDTSVTIETIRNISIEMLKNLQKCHLIKLYKKKVIFSLKK